MKPYLAKELHFLTPDYHSGLNTTVRLGTKHYKNLNVGDKVVLMRCEKHPTNCIPVKTANVLFRFLTHFDNLEFIPSILEHEHDQTCRTWDGLSKAMVRAYPNNAFTDFNGESEVTIVGFEVKLND